MSILKEKEKEVEVEIEIEKEKEKEKEEEKNKLTMLPFPTPILPSSQLFSLIEKASSIGSKSGFLVSFQSELSIIKDHGIPFLGRLAKNLSQKPIQQHQHQLVVPQLQNAINVKIPLQHNIDTTTAVATVNAVEAKKLKNPFLPPFEYGSHVCDLHEDHRLLLNKYNLVSHHILLVTKEYESQLQSLTEMQWQLMINILRSTNYLLFFNRGIYSGASQPHKHIQGIPRESPAHVYGAIDTALFNTESKIEHPSNQIQMNFFSNIYPFIHCSYLLDPPLSAHEQERSFEINGKVLQKIYIQMLDEIQRELKQSEDISTKKYLEEEVFSYNLLMTREYILIVPRRQETYYDKEADVEISINSLGFAGMFFCRSEKSLELMKTIGPLHILKAVTWPISSIKSDL